MARAPIVLIAILLLAGGLVLLAQPASLTCKGCNVILISIDTLGAKHTTVYDPAVLTTPFLADYAENHGVVFERAYAQVPWTLPSHTAMLTGRYPWEVGVEAPQDALPQSLTTLAESFARHGYKTAAFSTGAFVQPQWQFDQGFSEFHSSLAMTTWNDSPALFTDAAAWAASSSEPFFLFIHSFHVHDPYGEPGAGGIDIHDIVAANSAPHGPTRETADAFRTAYHREIRELDTALKDLIAHLEASGLSENTVVLITSDHGEEFGEHGSVGTHSITVYDENIHVPLLMFMPGTAPARIPYSVEVRSVAATLLASVDIEPEADMAPSLLPFITGNETDDRTVIARTFFKREKLLKEIETSYADLGKIESGTNIPLERTEPLGAPYTSAAIRGSRVVIHAPDTEPEAYDGALDPTQQQNLRTSAGIPASFDELLRALEDLQK